MPSDRSMLPARNDSELREFVARWKESFGGGMIPFDDVYFPARDRGDTPAEAQRQGVHALLDALVDAWEARDRG
jgi:hypothetical protein